MGTVIFVHGTGVRHEAFDRSFKRASSRLRQVRPDLDCSPCFWGDCVRSPTDLDLVLRLDDQGDRTAIDSPTVDREEPKDWGTIWELLLLDPLVELNGEVLSRAVRAPAPADAGVYGARLHESLDRPSESLVGFLVEHDLAGAYEGSVNSVLQSPVFRSFARRKFEPHLDSALLARAVTAQIIVDAARRDGWSNAPAAGTTDELVRLLVVQIGGEPKGFGLTTAMRLAQLLGAGRALDRRRWTATQMASPVLGDIAQYLVRGQRIRARIQASILGAIPPVTVLAHSLGGIAAFELLVETPSLPVACLATVGTQVSYLRAIDALPMLAADAPLRADFPIWFNFVDDRDWLAFAAEKTWPGQVRDVRIESRAAFPASHSAYFDTDGFYALLAEVLP